jgi:hypothetical protein
MKYRQGDFDPNRVKMDNYGDASKKTLDIKPSRSKGTLEVGHVKGYALDKYFVTITVGIFPPRPEMEMKGFYAIKMIPKSTNPLEVDDGKWTQMIKVRPENFLGVMSYSVSAYLVMRQLQGFTPEKMTEELASAFESGKADSEGLMADYNRLVQRRI